MASAGRYRKDEKPYYVYMLASRRNGTLYVGVTSDLLKRVYQHRNDSVAGFTRTYHVHRLVYYETTADVASAISIEKQLKAWKRDWKVELIQKGNPEWKDLYSNLL